MAMGRTDAAGQVIGPAMARADYRRRQVVVVLGADLITKLHSPTQTQVGVIRARRQVANGRGGGGRRKQELGAAASDGSGDRNLALGGAEGKVEHLEGRALVCLQGRRGWSSDRQPAKGASWAARQLKVNCAKVLLYLFILILMAPTIRDELLLFRGHHWCPSLSGGSDNSGGSLSLNEQAPLGPNGPAGCQRAGATAVAAALQVGAASGEDEEERILEEPTGAAATRTAAGAVAKDGADGQVEMLLAQLMETMLAAATKAEGGGSLFAGPDAASDLAGEAIESRGDGGDSDGGGQVEGEEDEEDDSEQVAGAKWREELGRLDLAELAGLAKEMADKLRADELPLERILSPKLDDEGSSQASPQAGDSGNAKDEL